MAGQSISQPSASGMGVNVRRRRAWRIMRNPTTAAGIILVALFVFLALFAPLISPFGPLDQNISAGLHSPNGTYFMGTDKLGRDIFSRIMYGARISIVVGAAVVLMAGSVGTLLGLLAGYLGGLLDEVMMRVTDIFFAFPSLILAMAIAGALGPSLVNALIAVAAVSWPVYARLVRGQVLGLREQEFVHAARALGVPTWQILLRHILPNTLAPLLVQITFDMGAAILSVAGLSFIGFGAQPPTPEWGVMISDARQYVWTEPLLILWPGLALFLSVMAFNTLGDAIRDKLDPHLCAEHGH